MGSIKTERERERWREKEGRRNIGIFFARTLSEFVFHGRFCVRNNDQLAKKKYDVVGERERERDTMWEKKGKRYNINS